jgi:membrane protein DedA with SNARE-associated domain
VTRARIVAVLVTALVAILVVSSTLGREIYAGRTPSLTSFALIHFAGYLFFLLMPVEALVPVYQAEGHSGGMLISVALLTALAAQAIDYGIGRSVSEAAVHKLIGEQRYVRFKAMIARWGGWAILIFNLFPLSSPNMLLVAGITRFSAPRSFLYSSLGLAVKYTALVYAFDAVALWMSRS